MDVGLPDYTFHGASSAEAVGETVPPSLARNNVPDLFAHWKGQGTVVLHLDTGVDQSHVNSGDLSGAIIDQRDFTGEGLEDENGHGSHTAGTIAARFGNGLGVTGTAPESKLVVAKVLGRSGRGDDRWIANAMLWGIQFEPDFCNLSLGSQSRSPRIEEALQQLVVSGCVPVVAAGNAGSRIGEPAARSYCIAVTAVDEHDRITSFSNFGPEADTAAPGKRILSLYRDGDVATLSGTSMACPYVSGMLCIAKESGAPVSTIDECLEWLESTSDDIGQPGKDAKYGWGIISTKKMLERRKVGNGDDGWQVGPLVIHMPARAGDLISVGV